MSLQIWLPLNGNLENLGLSNLTFSIYQSTTAVDSTGKIGKCYTNTATSWNSGGIVSNTTITLGSKQTMCCWFKFTGLGSNSNLGGAMCGQHRYPSCTGMGLTIKYITSTTGYLSINTGTGSTRTYNTYCGSTLLSANKWYHGAFTYDGSVVKIYVNGILDGTHTVGTLSNPSDYFQAFCWSFSGSSGSTPYDGYKLYGSINDIRAYDNVLSDAEIKEVARGLVAHYPLNNEYAEPTTNILGDCSRTFSNWNSYGSGYTSIKDNELGTKSIYCESIQSWCGVTKSFTIPSDGTYTLSVWCKPISRTSTSINQTLYFSGGGYSDNSTSVSWSSPGTWKRISMTRTMTAGTLTLYLIAYGGSRSSDYKITCEWAMPQFEKVDHMTPYTPSSRDETTVFDTSGFKNNGTITTSIAPQVIDGSTPRYSKCSKFSGAQYINCGRGAMVTDAISVSWWGYMSSWSSYTRAISCTEGGGWNFEPNSSKMSFPVYVSSVGYISATDSTALSSLSSGWHHFVGTYGNGTAKLYRDGSLVATITASSANPISYYSGNVIFIGCEAGGSTSPAGSYFVGNLSDVRIYATALSLEDVKYLYSYSISVTNDGTLMTQGEIVEV